MKHLHTECTFIYAFANIRPLSRYEAEYDSKAFKTSCQGKNEVFSNNFEFGYSAKDFLDRFTVRKT